MCCTIVWVKERNICQPSATDAFCVGAQGQTDLILPVADQNTFLNHSNAEVILCFIKPMIAFIYYCYPGYSRDFDKHFLLTTALMPSFLYWLGFSEAASS